MKKPTSPRRKKKPEYVSKCCQAPMTRNGSPDVEAVVTWYFVCTSCKQPCDPRRPSLSQARRIAVQKKAQFVQVGPIKKTKSKTTIASGFVSQEWAYILSLSEEEAITLDNVLNNKTPLQSFVTWEKSIISLRKKLARVRRLPVTPRKKTRV